MSSYQQHLLTPASASMTDKEMQERAMLLAKKRQAEAQLDRKLNNLLSKSEADLMLLEEAQQQDSLKNKNESGGGSDQLLQNTGDGDRIYGTEKDRLNCAFYLKIGACRYGDTCTKFHPKPVVSETLLVKNMFDGLNKYNNGLLKHTLPNMEDEAAEELLDTVLLEEELDEDPELLASFESFFADVHEEFQKFGKIVNFKICRNVMHHLRGNVYVQYSSQEEAVKAFHALQGRFYGGKQIFLEFCPVKQWKTALCGQYEKSRNCPKGRVCNFLHVFRNPGDLYAQEDFERENNSRDRSRSRSRDRRRSTSRDRRRSKSRDRRRSTSRDRRRDKSHRRESSPLLTSPPPPESRRSRDMSRSPARKRDREDSRERARSPPPDSSSSSRRHRHRRRSRSREDRRRNSRERNHRANRDRDRRF